MPANYNLPVSITNNTDVNFTNAEVVWRCSDTPQGGIVAFATVAPRSTASRTVPSIGCVAGAKAHAQYRDLDGNVKTLYLPDMPEAPEGQCYAALRWTINYGAAQEPQATVAGAFEYTT